MKIGITKEQLKLIQDQITHLEDKLWTIDERDAWGSVAITSEIEHLKEICKTGIIEI